MASCMNCPIIPKTDEKNPKIVCGGCDRQICVKCSGLCATELRVVMLQSPTLKYLCPDCKLGIRQLPALRKLVSQLKDEIDELKKSQSHGLNVESVISEISEREKRQKNVIMFGVPELTNGSDVDACKRHDLEKVNGALANIPESEVPVAAIRLGKPSQSPRPIKLIFARRSSAITLLKNGKKLPVEVKVKNDLTPYQREYLRGLREELERRTENGAVRCLPLPEKARENITSAITTTCSKIRDLVFAIMIAGNQLITLVRMKKYTLHPSDIHLLFNLVRSSESFKTAESWTPICLPKFDAT